jgi:tetratricopeptide (TPR) repeat protein
MTATQRNALRPGDVERLRSAAAAAEAGDLEGAIALAQSALADGLTHPLLLKLRAVKHEREGRVPEAIADLRGALVYAPDDAAARNALGLCLIRAGRPREALAQLDEALALNPQLVQAQLNRASALESLGDLVGARAAYERVAEREPANARAPAALAWLAARRADWTEARSRGAAALSDLREGYPAAAESAARKVLGAEHLPPHERSSAQRLLAEALEALDRPEEAFAAYAEANAVLRRFYPPAGGQRESALTFVQRLEAHFSQVAPGSWPDGPPADADRDLGAADGHVFVLGFPRSGTTLLGQVLAAHPQAVTIDEQELLAEAAVPYLERPGGLEKLQHADAAELAPHRHRYWELARQCAGDLGGKTLVDKLPMNTLALPLIARMFPQAKVVFVVRDPRDVVLSCFQQAFVPSRTSLEFLDLDRTASFYDAVMALAARLRAALNLPVLQVRLEDLVADFDGETRRLCEFAGLEWTAGLEDFSSAARAGRIATPSAAQVARGLHDDGVGRWRRYETALTPVMARLQPWIGHFGYGGD